MLSWDGEGRVVGLDLRWCNQRFVGGGGMQMIKVSLIRDGVKEARSGGGGAPGSFPLG